MLLTGNIILFFFLTIIDYGNKVDTIFFDVYKNILRQHRSARINEVVTILCNNILRSYIQSYLFLQSRLVQQ